MHVDPYQPCPWPAGSPGKLRWLAARARLRLPLFQRLDAGEVEAACGRRRRDAELPPRRRRHRHAYPVAVAV